MDYFVEAFYNKIIPIQRRVPMEILKYISAALVLLTSLCYFYQLVYLVLPLVKKPKVLTAFNPNRYAILIAARNEEAVLPHLLGSIQTQDYPRDLVTTYVIADNCTDQTAAVAAAGGAHVFQRFNTAQVGKGYALQYLIEQIRLAGELDQYDAFLIFDADNLLAPDYIRRINALCSAGFPAFCGYRNIKNYGSNWLSAGHGLCYLHESANLNRGRMMIGNCCCVSGTGFGFTRQLLDRLGGWNFTTLTEDIEFSTWCATHGVTIGYCNDAVLYDEQSTAFRASVRQRTRWIQGAIQVSLGYIRDYARGILAGGHTACSSFEHATISLWGYGISAVSCVTALLTTLLTARWAGFLTAMVCSLCGAYLSLFAIAALTTLTQWDRIRATKSEKLRALFTFPLFMFSYIPIAVMAVFKKREWKPIAHTVAIPVEQLQR